MRTDNKDIAVAIVMSSNQPDMFYCKHNTKRKLVQVDPEDGFFPDEAHNYYPKDTCCTDDVAKEVLKVALANGLADIKIDVYHYDPRYSKFYLGCKYRYDSKKHKLLDY